MLAKEIMTKDVIVVEEDSPISKAVELMLAHGHQRGAGRGQQRPLERYAQ